MVENEAMRVEALEARLVQIRYEQIQPTRVTYSKIYCEDKDGNRIPITGVTFVMDRFEQYLLFLTD